MKKKIILIVIILIMLILSFNIYIQLIYQKNIPILAYHDVIKNPINETDINIKNFESQMKYLYKHHYKTLSLDEFYEWKNGKNIKGKKVVLTFDDGDESFYKNVIPILEKYNFKAVNFVIGATINSEGYISEEQINDIENNHQNISIQSHSFNLHNDLSANSNDYDIYNSDININKKYEYYAYPFGISNDNYKKALKDNNYKLAFKFSPSKWSNKNQDNYEITRVPIYKSNSMLKFRLKLILKI